MTDLAIALIGIIAAVLIYALDEPSQHERDAWDLDGGYTTNGPRLLALLVAIGCIIALAVL